MRSPSEFLSSLAVNDRSAPLCGSSGDADRPISSPEIAQMNEDEASADDIKSEEHIKEKELLAR